MKKIFLIASLLFINSTYSFEASKAKILFRNLGKREQGFFTLQGGFIAQKRKNIQGFLVFFNEDGSAHAAYPVVVDFSSLGITALFTLIEHDSSIRFENFKKKTPRDFLGTYHGGKIGLSLMAGFKGAMARNKEKISLFDSSIKLSTLGVDFSYIKYDIRIDETYQKKLPYSWDEVID